MPRGILLDWRNLSRDVARHDVVVASDVLYERPYGGLVARALAATLADNGVAWIADPGRVARDTFVRALGPLNLQLVERTRLPFSDGSIRQTITILEIRRRALSGLNEQRLSLPLQALPHDRVSNRFSCV